MITSLAKWGNSIAIRIPQSILSMTGLDKDSKVQITCNDNVVTIKAVDKPTCLEDLFKGYSEEYKPQEMDWGDSVGKEVW